MSHTPLIHHLIAELLSTLQAEGYPLGTGQQLRVQELLGRLPEGVKLEELPLLLAPVFASNPKEQAHFYELFEQCRRRTEAFFREIEQVELHQPDHRGRRIRGVIWALLLLLLVPPAVVIYQLMKPVQRDYIEKPFQVQAGEQVVVCLIDSSDLKSFGTPVSYEVLYPGHEGLGSFMIDTPQCLSYIAQDSIEGQDSIVVEWSNELDEKLLARYKAIISLPEPTPEVDTVAGDTIQEVPVTPEPEPEAYTFSLQNYPFNHDPLAFAVQPPSRLRQFLAENFWWLKWGGFLLFSALLLAVLFYRAHRRRKLVAELESKEKPPYAWNIRIDGAEAINWGDDFGYILNLIRQRTGSEAFRLDMPRTIGATIEQGGMPAFRYQQQTQPPEYLLLIEQQTPRNHRARLANLLYQAFHANEVLIESFFFDSDLRVCYNEAQPEGVLLQDIQQRYASSRLIIIGYGNTLLNKLSGKLEPWSRLIRNWKHRLLLTPRPIQSWGKRERRLGELFVLMPLSMQSLRFWLEELEMEEDARFDNWPNHVKDAAQEPVELSGALIPSLQAYYSEPMLQWIAACAVYPSLHWDLTLTLGQMLSKGGDNLLTAGQLLELTRLPWFAEGRIPPASRVGLLNWLESTHPGLLQQVRTALADILQQNPPPSDSAAFEDYRMNVALNEWLTTRHKSRKRELEKEISSLMEAGADADVTVIKQLKRERSPLDFIVPDSWKKYLHPHGLPGLGWRGEWRDVLRWALPLWLPALLATAWPWQIKLTECQGPLVDYHLEGKDYLLCLNDGLALATMLEEQAKASINNDSLAGAMRMYEQVQEWVNGRAAVQLPFSTYGSEGDWNWRIGQLKNWGNARVEASRGYFELPAIPNAGIPEAWQAEYRSNMAVAYYNKGVDLYLSGLDFFEQSQADRETQILDGIEAWKKIKAGNSDLPPEVQQSMLSSFERLGLRDTSQLDVRQAVTDSLLTRLGQLIDSGRGRVCAYFQEAVRLDSTLFNLQRIRTWCTGEAEPEGGCRVIGNIKAAIALRSRPLSTLEARELSKYENLAEWDSLPLNRETLLRLVPLGAEVRLIEEGGDYYRIRVEGQNGYIQKTYGGRPTLLPCEAEGAGTPEQASIQAGKLQEILGQAVSSWSVLQKKTTQSYQSTGTLYPEFGVRGRYAILKPLINPAILEELVGEKVYRSGPHRGANIDYTDEEAFGYYNPAFLKKLLPTLTSLSDNKLFVKSTQGLYNREFRDVLRVFFQAYPVAANRKDIQDGFLAILNMPRSSRKNPYAIDAYFNDVFSGFAREMEGQGYDELEGYMAARFWVRRSIDGTADEFYRMLRLAIRTFDPTFLLLKDGVRIPSPESRSEVLNIEPIQKMPEKGQGEGGAPDVQKTAPSTHVARYAWCLDNTPDRGTSPLFDDGKTQLYEYSLGRDIAQRIAKGLDERGVAYFLVAPEETLSSEERARRIEAYNSRLPKMAVSVYFGAGFLQKGSDWADDSDQGVEAWYAGSSRQSERLSAIILEKIIQKTGLRNRYLHPSDYKGYTYTQPQGNTISALIRNGYYNNRADAAQLAQPAFRQKLADAYIEAILAIEAAGLDNAPAPLIDEQDSDGDRLGNADDFCPFTAGDPKNGGCPTMDVLPQVPRKSKN